MAEMNRNSVLTVSRWGKSEQQDATIVNYCFRLVGLGCELYEDRTLTKAVIKWMFKAIFIGKTHTRPTQVPSLSIQQTFKYPQTQNETFSLYSFCFLLFLLLLALP